MKDKCIGDILVFFDGLQCDNCKTRLIVIKGKDRTIIKNKLLVIDRRKGVISIKCRECGKIKTIVSSS